jgi:TonB family protein
MKILATIILALGSLYGASQTVTKYYDDHGNEVPADKAVYFVKFIKDKDMYQGTTYWKDDNALRGKGTYTDATLSSPDGTVVKYDKKGSLQDSIYYEGGKIDFSYRYYPNGQVAIHYHLPTNKTVGITEFFDENGKKINNFIMAREAEFNGGESAWQAYLKKSIDKDFAVKRDRDSTFPSAEVSFTIDEEGQVTNPKITRSSGFKNVDKDALRVISDSPKWTPAISYNKAIKANKVQTVMYDPGK